MPLVEDRQHAVVDRLDGRHDEQAAESREVGEQLASLQDVLDLRREIERQRRELGVHRPDNRQRVARAVQEIGIAEGDVRGAGRCLLADVRQHDIARHDEEAARAHRGNGTMTAEVQAAAARLGLAGQAGH